MKQELTPSLVAALLAAAPVQGAITFVDTGQRLAGNSSSNSADVALGDLDGDGDLDAVVADDSVTGANHFWINNGAGTFMLSPQHLGNRGKSVALADLDGDLDLDIVFLRGTAAGGAAQVWVNQGGSQDGTQGEFEINGQVIGLANGVVALGELDGMPGAGARPDAFIARPGGNQVWTNHFNANSGNPELFQTAQSLPEDEATDVALGDLDGDGDLDAFVTSGLSLSGGGPGPDKVWINQGGAQGGMAGVFLDSGQRIGAGPNSMGVALGDLDGDGDLDAFIAKHFIGEVWVNQGGDQSGTNGVLAPNGQSLGTNDSTGLATSVALGDLDGDGDLDAFVGRSGTNRVYANNGQGRFADAGLSLGGGNSLAVALGDLDNDGDLDAFVANLAAPDEVWLNVSPPPRMYFSVPAPGTLIDFGAHSQSAAINATKLISIGNAGTNDLTIQSASNSPNFELSFSRPPDTIPIRLPLTIPAGTSGGLVATVSRRLLGEPAPGDYAEIVRVQTSDAAMPTVEYVVHMSILDDVHGILEGLIAIFFILGQSTDSAASPSVMPFNADIGGPSAGTQTITLQLDTNQFHNLTTEIPSFLGGGSIVISNFTGSVTVTAHALPNDLGRYYLTIDGGSFTAPSFTLPSGIATGPNTLTFGPPEQSEGMLVVSNGNYTAIASATIVNDLFPQGFIVRGSYRGRFDFETGRASVESASTDLIPQTDQLGFLRSLTDFWLTWTLDGALESATNILGPWQPLTNAVSPFSVNPGRLPQEFFRVRRNEP